MIKMQSMDGRLVPNQLPRAVSEKDDMTLRSVPHPDLQMSATSDSRW